jgi:threonyl-tRNA synthetase
MAVRTIQLDYQQPENIRPEYIGCRQRGAPAGGHPRAILGSFERFIAILIEHYTGAFPLWLAPVQAIVLPISDRHLEYAGRCATAGAAGSASSSTTPGEDWL